jgi:hypothetical protein
MMGDLFHYKVSPTEIENMTFGSMKYWDEWYTLMKEEEKRTLDNA